MIDPYLELIAQGGPFPLAEEVVRGIPMKVWDREPATLTEAFGATRRHGAADALVYEGQRWSYDEQTQIVMGLARRLRERFDVRPGDRVAIAMRNYPEWCFSFWAVQVLGAVAVPMNAWSTGEELTTLLQDCCPVVLIADQERALRLQAHGDKLAMLRATVVVRGDRTLGVPFEELVENLDDREIEIHPAAPEDLATILYTSGTTGRPKGVLGTHRNHVSTLLMLRLRSEAILRAQGARASRHALPGIALLTTPLFHVAALTLMTANMYGGRRIILLYKWDVDEALRIIAREGVTDMSGPPTIMQEFVDAAKSGTHDTSSLRSLVSGAALTPPGLVADVHDTFGDRVSLGTGYGSTETMSTVLTVNGADFVTRPTSVGRALPIVEIRICDADGRITEPGTIGELHVRGPQISPGYYHQPEETLAAFRDGWYRTGDLARLDKDGFVHLSGRLKDVIIRGGENVQCAEVESALARHPAVLESAVFGLPHALLGEEVAAVVRTRAEGTVNADELTMFLRASIAAFKVPTVLRFTTEPLPRTATGKIVKATVKSSEPLGPDHRL